MSRITRLGRRLVFTFGALNALALLAAGTSREIDPSGKEFQNQGGDPQGIGKQMGGRRSTGRDLLDAMLLAAAGGLSVVVGLPRELRSRANDSGTGGGPSKAAAQRASEQASLEGTVRGKVVSSEKVARIVNAIGEIAFQTNLLAMNAAVDAAHAAEAAMGCAAVAGKVRNLAQHSAGAVRDAAGMIEESLAISTRGGSGADRTDEVLGALTDHARKVKALVARVRTGSDRRAEGARRISRNKANARRAASGEEMAAWTQALNDLAVRLREMVEGQSPATAGTSHAVRTRGTRSATPGRRGKSVFGSA